jgi:RsiW-degrading membrane proteinase PrsW (M82 family)
MLSQMTGFFNSAFYFAGTNWKAILVAVALGLVLGAVWLVFYLPPLFKKQMLWVVAAVSAILTWSAIAFVQIPLQNWYVDAIKHFWGSQDISNWYLYIAFPLVLLSGLVQEATKLVPTLFWWWRSKRSLTPKMGLIIGAVSGAGFGVFEAIWVHNQIFVNGISWSVVNSYALGLWERVFTVAFHIAASALTGWGIAKRKGWLFYVIAAFLHGFVNYSVILIQDNKMTATQSEIYLTVIAVVSTALVLWLRWRKEKEIPAEIPLAGAPGDPSEITAAVAPAADGIPPVVTSEVTPPAVTPEVPPPPPIV